MNWFMPAFVSRSPDSGGGISDELGTRLCPRSSKKRRNDSRMSRPCIAGSLPTGLRAPDLSRRIRGGPDLGFLLGHRALALGDRLREQLRDVHHATPGFSGEVRGRDT